MGKNETQSAVNRADVSGFLFSQKKKAHHLLQHQVNIRSSPERISLLLHICAPHLRFDRYYLESLSIRRCCWHLAHAQTLFDLTATRVRFSLGRSALWSVRKHVWHPWVLPTQIRGWENAPSGMGGPLSISFPLKNRSNPTPQYYNI